MVPTASEFVKAWNEAAQKYGYRKCLGLTKERLARFRKLCRDPVWAANWRKALDLMPTDRWLNGGAKTNGFVPGVEYFLRYNTVVRLIERAGEKQKQGTWEE